MITSKQNCFVLVFIDDIDLKDLIWTIYNKDSPSSYFIEEIYVLICT